MPPGVEKPGKIPNLYRQVTIISAQDIADANNQLAEQGVDPFDPIAIRRNLLVNIGPKVLNSMVGVRFRIGNILLQGVQLCTPCKRPPTLVGRSQDGAAFEAAFKERGGLRALIIEGGEINVGDEFKPLEQTS